APRPSSSCLPQTAMPARNEQIRAAAAAIRRHAAVTAIKRRVLDPAPVFDGPYDQKLDRSRSGMPPEDHVPFLSFHGTPGSGSSWGAASVGAEPDECASTGSTSPRARTAMTARILVQVLKTATAQSD